MKFQKTRLVFIALLSLNLLALTACDDGGGKKRLRDVRPDYSQYTKASCEYGFTEGPSANNFSSQVISSYFGKKINMGHLRSVLGASGSEVVRFAENLGVTFYKTNLIRQGACEFTASLPQAPGDLEPQFLKLENILGLYLPVNSPNMPSTSNRAAILVRRDSNKWVLVHEFMHHLFQLQVENEFGRSYDVKSEFLNAVKSYESAALTLQHSSGANRKSAVKNAVQKLVAVNSIALQLVKQYMLEEMTIESIMAEKVDAGELTLVVAGQRLNGAAYIIESDQKAKEFLGMLSAESNNIWLVYSRDMDSNDSRQLLSFTSEVTKLEGEMDTLKRRAIRYVESLGIPLRGRLAQVDLETSAAAEGEFIELHTGCAHSHEAEEIMEQAAEMITK